jgi:UDP-2,4-diacetamido-2,4,6-trideoxy-beta-L-altropyranose hydrolase
VFRVDANAEIGSGHVGRCLGLAQELQDRGDRVIFAAAELGGVRPRITAEGFEIADVAAIPGSNQDGVFTAELCLGQQAAWLITDGYYFRDAFQNVLATAKVKTLLMDDYGQLGIWRSRYVLDQNFGAREDHYAAKAPGTRLLKGSRYVLLRREFKKWKHWERQTKDHAHNVLVTLGGGNAEEASKKILTALALVPENAFDVIVVVGPNADNGVALKQLITEHKLPVRLEVNPKDMPALLAWADLAISAAGSTCWEMCYLGLPAIVFALASNQVETAESLRSAGAVKYFGDWVGYSQAALANELQRLAAAHGEREHMSQTGRSLIDGGGAPRLADLLFQPAVRLRPVSLRDSELLWKWANDPELRKQSFTQEAIDWSIHEQWLKSSLEDRDTVIRIAENDRSDSVGVVRFTLQQRKAVISISLAQEFRGTGLAPAVLKCALDELTQTRSIQDVSAFVKPENLPSVRLFENAGFVCTERTSVRGQAAMHLVLRT